MITITINTSDGKNFQVAKSTQGMADYIRAAMNIGGTFQIDQGDRILMFNSKHVASILFVKGDM